MKPKYEEGDEVYIKQDIVGYIQGWREEPPNKHTIAQIRNEVEGIHGYTLSYARGDFNQDQLVSPAEAVLVALDTRGEYETAIKERAYKARTDLWRRTKVITGETI